jgi:hypothetical protein
MVLYELATGQVPFADAAYKFDFQLKEAIVAGQRPSLEKLPYPLPPEVPAIIMECWAQNPSDRPTMPKILKRFNQVSLSMLCQHASAKTTP